jgi:hypothetical protein
VVVGIDGTKHPLALVEGSTENTTVVIELLTGLRERGIDTTGRSWSATTARRRCALRSPECSTIR